MNFFEQQARARRNTTLAVVLFLLAVVAIIACIDFTYVATQVIIHSRQNPEIPIKQIFQQWWSTSWPHVYGVAAATAGVIILASIYRIIQLRGGGAQVAKQMGGILLEQQTNNQQEQRLLNIVSEMALASGIPTPPVYILRHEVAMNAFAAGFTTNDAVIGVTQGCLDNLTRDELQGVIGHEFSHILNGDMRLNIRLIGALYGILVLAIAGRMLVSSLRYSLHGGRSRRSNSNNNAAALQIGLVVFGLALMVVGYLGVFFARLIQAAVSRQREFLADASAVQFTRNPQGISGALKKIAVHASGAKLNAAHSQEVSHLLFGQSHSSFLELLATHPPLLERIKRIEPQFRPEELIELKQKLANNDPTQLAASLLPAVSSPVAGFIAQPPLQEQRKINIAQDATTPLTKTINKQDFFQTIGQPSFEHLQQSKETLTHLPTQLTDALVNDLDLLALLYAIIMEQNPTPAKKQIMLLQTKLSAPHYQQTAVFYQLIKEQPTDIRFTLLQLSLRRWARLPKTVIAQGLSIMEELVKSDGKVGLIEYLMTRLLAMYLVDLDQPVAQAARLETSVTKQRASLQVVFSALAHYGQNEAKQIRQAYDAAMANVFGSSWPPYQQQIPTESALDEALNQLDTLHAKAKAHVIKAMTILIGHDQVFKEQEVLLLQLVCARMHCPVPFLTVE